MTLTGNADPGPTRNYFWDNGAAQIDQNIMPKPGGVVFSCDSMGRSSIARASLTYQMFTASADARNGTPLDPPTGWPKSNPEQAITFSLTGKTYHGYLWNRSHSVADSLAGAQSYTSPCNFTSGTRAQNVGADQNGGMRAAEELAENYWKTHKDSTTTIWYQTTPIYQGSELIPRGSVVDELSSDGTVNAETVVINDAEGWTINYNTGDVTHR